MGLALTFIFQNYKALSQIQSKVQGVVVEESEQGQFSPMEAVSVFWLGTNEGVLTDSSGFFSIPIPAVDSLFQPLLIIRHLGYEADTLSDFSQPKLRIILASSRSKKLVEVIIEERVPTSFLMGTVLNTTQMGRKELTKAACCNLSESFETNPSVDVSYSDAVSGAKQIQLLGLSGNYILMTQENLPGIRGLLSGYGFGFVPGPWIESIQLTKGQGSVVNGYESLTGQINLELKKPDWTPKTREKWFLNLYGNSMGRTELNINKTSRIVPGLTVTHLIHANQMAHKSDLNKDNFLDIPTGSQIQAMQRWAYEGAGGIRAQAGIQFMNDSRVGGTIEKGQFDSTNYPIGLENRQIQAFGKIGYLFPNKKYKSIGWLNSWTQNRSRNNYGQSKYEGDQRTVFSNLIYQSIIGSTNLTFKTGGGIRWDEYKESVSFFNGEQNSGVWNRTEVVPGVFGEMTWNPKPWISQVFGLRYDYHNIFGHWLTPRIHSKIEFSENSVIRLSAGIGRRLANIFAENPSLFVSSRRWYLPSEYNQSGIYLSKHPGYVSSIGGLKPERAFNLGLSWSQSFRINNRKGNVNVDLFHTRFMQQTIVDLDINPQAVFISNLTGESYATAFQIQAEYEPVRRLDVRIAWKMQDVQQTLAGRLQDKPFVANQRFFVNFAFETKSKWNFDATLNWTGSKRLPFTGKNPEIFQIPSHSPDFFIFNGQVTKAWKSLELYGGVENLFDFRQNQLIVNPSQPNQPYFDASMVWGPVIGRMWYSGLRCLIR